MIISNNYAILQKGTVFMEDIIIIVILAVIVGLAGWYVYKAKKSGKKCIGCPDGCSCSSKSSEGGCGCGCGCCGTKEE